MSFATVKWWKFAGGPITQWGQATPLEAQAYNKMRARRYPEATYTEVAGDPGDEGSTIIIVHRMLGLDDLPEDKPFWRTEP